MQTTITKWVMGHKITSFAPNGDFDFIQGETPAHVPGPPPHVHDIYSESFMILEGAMEFVVNGEPRLVKAGEFVDIPPRTVHTFANTSNEPCKWVNIHSPKGFLQFFDDMGVSADDAEAQQKSVAPELIENLIKNSARYDMILATPTAVAAL